MNYFVQGYFYLLPTETKPVKARSVLTITKATLGSEEYKSYDLLVVMMNPGSSSPKCDGHWKEKPINRVDDLVEAIPDNTQFQIMKVMDKTGYNNAIILNLSDICETDSYIFAKRVSGCDYSECGVDHSIFSDTRSEELSMLLNNFTGDTAILASGVKYKLRFLTQQMLGKIKIPNLISKLHANGLFYHPLPRGGQESWVTEIVNKLKS